MFEAENLQDWVGSSVVDESGDKIGSLESIYFDTSTDLPSFAAIKIGFLGSQKLVFVPLAGGLVSPKHVKVMFAKKLVTQSPSIPTDGEFDAALEPSVFAHYDIPYQVGANGERRLGRH